MARRCRVTTWGSGVDRFELTFVELDLLGAALEVDVRPFPFTFPSVGRTWEERARAADEANQAMTGRGLIRGGRFDPDLEKAIRLFGAAPAGIGMLGAGPDGTLIARGGTDGQAAAAAQQWGDGVRVLLGRPEELVGWLLGLLPQHPRGVGESAVIPMSDGEGAGRANDDLSDYSYTSGGSGRSTRERDREAVQRLLAGQIGTGYFVVTGASQQHTVDWIDTDSGRYMAFSTFDSVGRQSLVYTPADFRQLADKLNGYVHEVLDGNRHGASGVTG